MLLFCYEVFATRRKWTLPPPEDPDDPWRSSFDDLYDWFSGPRVKMVIAGFSISIISLGTFFSMRRLASSTYFCFPALDSPSRTVSLQVIGLGLDAAIIVVLWRLLAWSRSNKTKLRILGTVLTLSSLSMGLLWMCNSMLLGSQEQLRLGFGALYGLDIVIDSAVFAILMVSAALWLCHSSPLIPASAITISVGLWGCMSGLFSWSDWLHLQRAEILVPLWTIAGSTGCFLYFQDVKSLFFLRRIYIVFLLVAVTIGATTYTSLQHPQEFDKRHPISDLIYKGHIAHDHWLRKVRISQSLPVAIATYEERHSGRAAPPNFSSWYDFAKETVVVDDFPQIDQDLAIFWNLKPEMIRERVKLMAERPTVFAINIKDGQVTHDSPTGDSQEQSDLADLVKMIGKFSQHLPDMTLPINLGPSPRILPSWNTAHSGRRAGSSAAMSSIHKRSHVGPGNATSAPLDLRNTESETKLDWAHTLVGEYRQMQVDGCPPSSLTRTSPRWNIAEFCSICATRHSKGPMIIDWERSLDTCAQPDLKYLHGLYLTAPQLPPIQELLPLFSLAKTDSFSDILIPLPRVTKGLEADIKWQFSRRYDNLFWQGKIGQRPMNHQYLRGNHKIRLLHLLRDAEVHEEAVLILPSKNKKDKFEYERVSAAEANNAAPFSIGIEDYSTCTDRTCELVQQTYGPPQEASQEPLEYRYVLLLDDDNGPPVDMGRALHSGSVPFVSTIFRTWYTERIQPWLHFVPIDQRYQALHTTYLYFTGTENRTMIGGRDTNMKGRVDDAEWIAHQGQKWAEEALGERDMEVYLFRLLLEWGRLIDDQRDTIGFRKTKEGGFDNVGFTKRH